MTRLPSVTEGLLRGPGVHAEVAVGSAEWFAWLAAEPTRSFAFRCAAGGFTARRERRQRGSAYWYAYRTANGRQRKVYLGKADELTAHRLAEAAADLGRRCTARSDEGGMGPDPLPSLTVLPVLAPKITVPPLRSGTVLRPRLHERLRAAPDAALTTVVAPAGWGKTTLLSSWAHDPEERRPVGWLSIDEGDDQPVRFWTYVLSALHRVAPDVTGAALAAIGAPVLDPVNLALTALLNDLAPAADEYVLVLDDYHLLTDALVHESVEFLLDYLPPALRVVIASRTDPPLPLARMRARGTLTEIRVGDLRCTVSEGAALLADVVGVSGAAADGLVAKTEGWAAGLRLAALTIRDAEDSSAAAEMIGRDARHVLDYFDAEVLKSLDPEQHDLLVRCSVLERLSGPLCDAVLGTTGSSAVLAALDRADMFIIPLGGPWYRCHQLFRDALRRELDLTEPEVARRVRSRAAEWFLAGGHLDEAIAHRIAAGEEEAAGELIRANVGWFLDRGAMSMLMEWGERLAATDADPRLLLVAAAAACHCGRLDRAARCLAAAEPHIDAGYEPMSGWGSLRAWADTTWSVCEGAADPESALTHARQAARLEDDPTRWGYVVARQGLAGAFWAAGMPHESIAVLRETRRAPVHRLLPALPKLQGTAQLALNLIDVGEPTEARRLCAEVSDIADAAERTWGAGAAAAVAILRHAEGKLLALDDPAAALPALRRAVELAETWGPPVMVVGALTSLAAAQAAADDIAGARTSIDRGREAAEEIPRHSCARRLRELDAELGRRSSRAARRRRALTEELTDRELSVLRALRSTLSTREIGTELYLSINTVKGYKKSLYRKLGVVSREDAVRAGRELGLA